jgi:hypothetical protein
LLLFSAFTGDDCMLVLVQDEMKIKTVTAIDKL